MILAVGIWHEAMVTLATAVVGTLLVVVLALVVGVLMANDRRVDLVVRPVLDTAQTIPAFVYLVPALALFGSTRFTAMVAAVIYGAPVAIKLVCDGIRGVSPTTVEAARSTGTTRWQLVTRVQLPMARSSVALAANQGLLYVFAVVVIGGLVGAGGSATSWWPASPSPSSSARASRPASPSSPWPSCSTGRPRAGSAGPALERNTDDAHPNGRPASRSPWRRSSPPAAWC